MAGEPAAIRFSARLLRPAKPPGASWSFLVLPKAASARMPSRGLVAIVGTLKGHPFRATLEPDGQKGHWLKVSARLRAATGAAVGDVVVLEIRPATRQPQPRVPRDVQRALSANPQAGAPWSALTVRARRDWIQWITSAKQPETRARRIRNMCEMLAAGKRRVCCFDRSGFYSQGLGAPEAAESLRGRPRGRNGSLKRGLGASGSARSAGPPRAHR